jgi:hypothetical protein
MTGRLAQGKRTQNLTIEQKSDHYQPKAIAISQRRSHGKEFNYHYLIKDKISIPVVDFSQENDSEPLETLQDSRVNSQPSENLQGFGYHQIPIPSFVVGSLGEKE